MGTAKRHEITIEPIIQWPGKPVSWSKPSQFKASLESTQKLLDAELTHLNAKSVVMQMFLDRSQIRLDGGLRAGATPRKPGIILSFSCKHGQLMYPCDTFKTWRENLRAIALALQALRSVDRYGVTSRAEQYKGWQQLPSPGGPTIKTRDQALEFLGKILGCTLSELRGAPLVDAFIRQAQMKTHPDKGGDPEDFKRVMECEKVLKSA